MTRKQLSVWPCVPGQNTATVDKIEVRSTAEMRDGSFVGHELGEASQWMIERLEAENVELRRIASEVMLQIGALRRLS